MATYYGKGPDGQMGHIRLKESLEEWHVRCAEQGESIRKLREDIPRGYSWKGWQRRLRDLEAGDKAWGESLALLRSDVDTISMGLAKLLITLGLAAVVTMEGEDTLPCPECGKHAAECPHVW